MVKKPLDYARKQLHYCNSDDSVPKIADLMENKYVNSILVKDIDGKLLIVGTGPLESKMRALAESLGVSDKVVFMATCRSIKGS